MRQNRLRLAGAWTGVLAMIVLSFAVSPHHVHALQADIGHTAYLGQDSSSRAIAGDKSAPVSCQGDCGHVEYHCPVCALGKVFDAPLLPQAASLQPPRVAVVRVLAALTVPPSPGGRYPPAHPRAPPVSA